MTKLMALVVDDSRVARMTLSKLLRDHSYSSVEWGSAEEAMQWLQTTDTLPDIIFMDVMMATMDGLTATNGDIFRLSFVQVMKPKLIRKKRLRQVPQLF